MIKIIPDTINKMRLFRKARWKNGIECPRCKSKKVHKIKKEKDGKNIYYCSNCRKNNKEAQFSDLTGSLFHNTKIKFDKLCLLLHFFSENYSARKTFSAMEKINHPVNPKTVERFFRLFRSGIRQHTEKEYFEGQHFEADETYISAKLHTKKFPGYKTHKQMRLEGIKRGIGSELQTPVFTLISKKGEWTQKKGGEWEKKYKFNVRFDLLESANRQNLEKKIKKFLPISRLQFVTMDTDTHFGYNFLKKICRHRTVKHNAKEYVGPDGTSINCAESWHSWIKTIGMRTYRMISKKYLLDYLYEFAAKIGGKNNEDDFCGIFGRASYTSARKQNGGELPSPVSGFCG